MIPLLWTERSKGAYQARVAPGDYTRTSLFDFFDNLLHHAQPSAELSTARNRVVREAAVTVVAVALTFRSSLGGAAVHPAPAVRHRRRAARAFAPGFSLHTGVTGA